MKESSYSANLTALDNLESTASGIDSSKQDASENSSCSITPNPLSLAQNSLDLNSNPHLGNEADDTNPSSSNPMDSSIPLESVEMIDSLIRSKGSECSSPHKSKPSDSPKNNSKRMKSKSFHDLNNYHHDCEQLIKQLRSDLAAANSIIISLCSHLQVIGLPGEHDLLISQIRSITSYWHPHIEGFFSPIVEIQQFIQTIQWNRFGRLIVPGINECGQFGHFIYTYVSPEPPENQSTTQAHTQQSQQTEKSQQSKQTRQLHQPQQSEQLQQSLQSQLPCQNEQQTHQEHQEIKHQEKQEAQEKRHHQKQLRPSHPLSHPHSPPLSLFHPQLHAQILMQFQAQARPQDFAPVHTYSQTQSQTQYQSQTQTQFQTQSHVQDQINSRARAYDHFQSQSQSQSQSQFQNRVQSHSHNLNHGEFQIQESLFSLNSRMARRRNDCNSNSNSNESESLNHSIHTTSTGDTVDRRTNPELSSVYLTHPGRGTVGRTPGMSHDNPIDVEQRHCHVSVCETNPDTVDGNEPPLNSGFDVRDGKHDHFKFEMNVESGRKEENHSRNQQDWENSNGEDGRSGKHIFGKEDSCNEMNDSVNGNGNINDKDSEDENENGIDRTNLHSSIHSDVHFSNENLKMSNKVKESNQEKNTECVLDQTCIDESMRVEEGWMDEEKEKEKEKVEEEGDLDQEEKGEGKQMNDSFRNIIEGKGMGEGDDAEVEVEKDEEEERIRHAMQEDESFNREIKGEKHAIEEEKKGDGNDKHNDKIHLELHENNDYNKDDGSKFIPSLNESTQGEEEKVNGNVCFKSITNQDSEGNEKDCSEEIEDIKDIEERKERKERKEKNETNNENQNGLYTQNSHPSSSFSSPFHSPPRPSPPHSSSSPSPSSPPPSPSPFHSPSPSSSLCSQPSVNSVSKFKKSRKLRNFGIQHLKMKKDELKCESNFVCYERISGELMNVVEGLELYHDVFKKNECERIIRYVEFLQLEGENHRLHGRTFSDSRRQIRGNGRLIIQFGCFYNFIKDRRGVPPGILQDERVEPIPQFFENVIERLITCGIIKSEMRPDSIMINIYPVGACIPPHTDHDDFDRPILTLSLLSSCDILFGFRLFPGKPGYFHGPFKLLLPIGSVLLLKGNSADVAKHAISSVDMARISITFRKMKLDKLPRKSSIVKRSVFSFDSIPKSMHSQFFSSSTHSMDDKEEGIAAADGDNEDDDDDDDGDFEDEEEDADHIHDWEANEKGFHMSSPLSEFSSSSSIPSLQKNRMNSFSTPSFQSLLDDFPPTSSSSSPEPYFHTERAMNKPKDLPTEVSQKSWASIIRHGSYGSLSAQPTKSHPKPPPYKRSFPEAGKRLVADVERAESATHVQANDKIEAECKPRDGVCAKN